jgi:alanine dehydrogenase
VTLPYVVQLANKGFEAAIRSNSALAQGVNIRAGKVMNPAVAETFGMTCAGVLDS